MKTNAIIRIVIWSLVLVILVGILGSFVSHSALSNLRRAHSGSTQEEAPVQALPNENTLTLAPDAIREIKIEWVAGDIIIQPMDTDVITVSESDISDPRYTMVWQDRGEKLEIHFCEDSITVGFGVNLDEEISKDLYIYVPRDWMCDSLEIDAASATVEINDLTIRELDFDGASGTCNLENCIITDLDIDTASGDVRFSGSLTTLDFDAASASFIGEFVNTPSRIDMDGMSGDLDIALPEDTGFTVIMDGLSSHFSSEFQTGHRNGTEVYGDGRCRINVDGMSCDVTIRKGASAAIAPTEQQPELCTDPDCTVPEEHYHRTVTEVITNEAYAN